MATHPVRFWERSRVCGRRTSGAELSRSRSASRATGSTQRTRHRLLGECSSYLLRGLVIQVRAAQCGAGTTPTTARSCQQQQPSASTRTTHATGSATSLLLMRSGRVRDGRRGTLHDTAGRDHEALGTDPTQDPAPARVEEDSETRPCPLEVPTRTARSATRLRSTRHDLDGGTHLDRVHTVGY